MATQHGQDDHEAGTMDITQQQKTFVGFLAVAKWTIIISLVALIFMALVNG